MDVVSEQNDPLQSYTGKQSLESENTMAISEESSTITDEQLITKIIDTCSILAKDAEKKFDSQKECDRFWSELFHQHWVKKKEWTAHCDDDCLYYVKKAANMPPSPAKQRKSADPTGAPDEEKFCVRRIEAKGHPLKNDPAIEWESTMLLNIILHHFQYEVEVSIRTRYEDTKSKEKAKLSILKKVSKTVYAIPSKIRMDVKNKAEEVEYTYPFLYFAIGDFDETWKDITLTKDGELVCVELYAVGDYFTKILPSTKKKSLSRCRLFAGALDYAVIKREYKNKTGMWSSGSKQFFNLQGPNGKGGAEMAVQPQAQAPETTSEDQGSYWWNMSKAVVAPFKRLGGNAPDPDLNCSMTSLSIRWDVIMQDLLAAYKKAAEKEKK